MKRIFSALGIALAVVCLFGIALVGVFAWPVLQDGNEARRIGGAIAAAMRDDWSESKFAFYASPRLLALNPGWKDDLADVRKRLGKIQSVGLPKSRQVIRDETVPRQVIYVVEVPFEAEKGSAVMHLGLARFEPGMKMTQFYVTDQATESKAR